jgi:ABC-2 type transport system ATP-binding protein
MSDSRGLGGTDLATTQTVVELRQVKKRYGKVEALAGLDLRVQRGQIYGFLGRNGAGKTTALRALMGIVKPTGGAISLFGEPVKASSVRYRQRIGYVAQEQHFYEWMTPRALGQFVSAFYPSHSTQEYQQHLRRFELPDRKIRTFSTGMKAKLALALALAHQPELLVLDEPTAGLDAVARREFIDMVRDQVKREGRTTLLSSHLIHEAELVADHVGIIEQGKMRFEGSLAALAEDVKLVSWPVTSGDAAPKTPLPAGLLVLRERVDVSRRELVVQQVAPGALSALRLSRPDSRVIDLPLEEIFIAMVSQAWSVETATVHAALKVDTRLESAGSP